MKYVANDEQDEKEFEEYIESLKKVYVSMEEAEIYDKELEKQMSLILDNIKEWDAKIKNSIVKNI